MSNIIIGYNNLISAATLSGGAWSTSYPQNNIKTRFLNQAARSTNVLAASTLINIDLVSAKPVLAFAAIKTNISASGATYRLRGSNDNTFATSLYDSGTLSMATQTPHLIVGLPSVITARYWRLEIIDTSNPAGYLQIGHIFIGDGFQPSSNYSRGAEIGYESRTEITESLGGVEYFNSKASRRVFNLRLDWLTDSEAYADAMDLQAIAGIENEVLLIADRADATYNQQRNFLGRLRQLSPLQNPYLTVNQASFNIIEIVA